MINFHFVSPDFNPPTPAFAKAGAAPGTTGGVEPVFVGLQRLKIVLARPTLQATGRSMASHGRSSLPFAGLSTLKTLQNLLGTHNPAGTSYPKATSMASYGRSSLPLARP